MSTPETKKYSECSVERRRGEKFRWTSPGAFAILRVEFPLLPACSGEGRGAETMPHIIEVTDLTAPELDVYARLTCLLYTSDAADE